MSSSSGDGLGILLGLGGLGFAAVSTQKATELQRALNDERRHTHDLTHRNEALALGVKQRDATIDDLKSKVQVLDSEAWGLRDANGQLRSQHADDRAEIVALRAQLDKAQRERNEARSERDDARRERDERRPNDPT